MPGRTADCSDFPLRDCGRKGEGNGTATGGGAPAGRALRPVPSDVDDANLEDEAAARQRMVSVDRHMVVLDLDDALHLFAPVGQRECDVR